MSEAQAPPHPGEGHTGAGGANALRAAVLGANDGLVSVLSLVMGVVGGGLVTQDILLAGIAGLMSGACSMAMGEWVSVQSAREMYELQLAEERVELVEYPEYERLELIDIFVERGIDRETATVAAEGVLADPEKALETMAREELGFDPDEMGGSAYQAAIASFTFFLIGATPPVIPFAFLERTPAIYLSLILSSVMLVVIGVLTSRFTRRGPVYAGVRQLSVGLAAAGVTYAIGSLFNVAVS
jgi:VIT1/CCC1 family predicted Fe2+/Mn2+ transporter